MKSNANTPLDDQTRTEYLDKHIPYRMTFVDMLRFACETLRSSQRPKKVEIKFDSQTVVSSDSVYLVTNPFLETGTLYCRVLLEFLGIKRDEKSGELKERKSGDRRNKDLIIEDFDVKKLSISELDSFPFDNEPMMVKKALASTICLAHKGIAHLTTDPVEESTVDMLYISSRIVPWLICRHLYEKLSWPKPSYEIT